MSEFSDNLPQLRRPPPLQTAQVCQKQVERLDDR